MTDPTPTTIPWYKSQILQGLIVAVVAQVLAHSGLAAVITPDQGVAIVNWILEALSAGAAAYAARARVVGPVHPIAGTQTAKNALAAAGEPGRPKITTTQIVSDPLPPTQEKPK